MRWELLWNPALASERLAFKLRQRGRMKKLRGTPAKGLLPGHIDSFELIELARPLGIKVIYDVGANVGTWALLARSVIPEAVIEAFEPLARHHGQFKENLRGAGMATLHPVALGASNMSAVLRVTDFSDASSLLPLAEKSRTQFGLTEVEQVEVPVWRLDDYRASQKLTPPDLIKLDVQGYELEVLKGAPDCLRAAKAVIAEVSFVEYYRGQCLFHDLVAFLAGFDLQLAAFGVNTPLGAVVDITDVLFLRRTAAPAK